MDTPVLRFDPQSQPRPHILPATPMVALEIMRGRVQQRIRPIAGKVFLIGAANDCDLVLGDLQFPEAYAYVFVSGSSVSIRRLGAGPELVVCGEQVESAELFHGDLLDLGPFELRVLIDDAPRGGRRSDDESESTAVAARLDAERAGAIHEVRMLLVDIRRHLSEDSPVLRLYHDSDHSTEQGCRVPQRASA